MFNSLADWPGVLYCLPLVGVMFRFCSLLGHQSECYDHYPHRLIMRDGHFGLGPQGLPNAVLSRSDTSDQLPEEGTHVHLLCQAELAPAIRHIFESYRQNCNFSA